MKISIWHNIMWSRYKAVVFSALSRQAEQRHIDVKIYQIAETELSRAVLSPVDMSWHDYRCTLVFQGAYSNVPRLKLFWALARQAWLDSADVTILTGYERPEVWLQVLALMIRGKKFAWFCDSTILDKRQDFFKGIAKRILFGLSSGLFCYGQRASDYVAHYGASSEKIFNRCQAAALPLNYSRENARADRIRLAATPDAPRYLYVGRLSPEKSLTKLLTAFSKVLQSRPTAKLVLVGKGSDEDLLKALSKQLDIQQQVEFAGAKYDQALFDEYSKATCLTLPSFSEPWGLVVNESLSYGCPAIVSNRCGCVPELVENRHTGFTYDWESVEDLAEKMNLAPDTFSDVSTIADFCLDRIAPFTPEAAANSILNGCEAIATKGR